MFNFGSAADQASIYFDRAIGVTGPLLPECPLDEMSIQDLRNAIAYCRIAYVKAEQEGMPKNVLDILLADYDMVFARLAKYDPDLKAAVMSGRHVYLGGYTTENVAKYRAMAGLA
jgi:hypothetical protein